MAHFSMSNAGVSDESSDSDHKHKRRKPNPIHHSFQTGTPKSTSATPPAAPNSFAAKMMAKMGYVEGQGLGATGRGRLAPIETQLRPQGAGLGVVKEKTKQAKEEEKREAKFRGEKVEDSSEEERNRKKKLKEKRKLGGSGRTSTPTARAKPKYRTAADIEAAAEGLEIPNVLKSIIDATGHETRLLTSTSGLMSAQSSMVPAETESMKLSRMAQRESVAFAEEWRALQERKKFFEQQERELHVTREKQDDENQTVDSLIEAVAELETLAIVNPSWEQITTAIETLANSIDINAGAFDLEEAAVGVMHPLFKATMLDWDPLIDPDSVVPYLRRLTHVLCPTPRSNSKEIASHNGMTYSRSKSKSTTHFETMLYSFWLPPMRSAVTRWDVYTPGQLIPAIEAWQPVLPPFILANVIDQLVIHRLTAAITAWKPKKGREGNPRSSSPYKWLFPWLPLLDELHTDPTSSTGIMSHAKRTLKGALSTWDLGRGVFPDLEHWASVYGSDLPHMLVRLILPRLADYFSAQFDVDPSDQDMKPLEKVLQWIPYFSLPVMAQLLADVFFKKWHSILYLWLIGKPDHNEIMEWYQWWRTQFEERLPQGFSETPIIAACWEKGLTIINVALDSIERGSDVATELHALMFETVVEDTPPTPTAPGTVAKPLDTPTTFKDVVEDWCTDNGLLMFPMREAELQTGLPLFRLTASASGKGGVVLYLKGDVVWVRVSGTQNRSFAPMALDDALAARAEGK